jgi:HTH-type transcriptional regulator/antitoxin HigA
MPRPSESEVTMSIDPIHDHASHAKALRRIEALWDAEPGTAEATELDALATLVDAYERKRFPILPPDPIEAIEARLEQLGWKRKDLEPLIGSRARVSEVLNRKRSLTLPMIRKLHTAMTIPAEVLLGEEAKRSRRPPRSEKRTRTRIHTRAETRIRRT